MIQINNTTEDRNDYRNKLYLTADGGAICFYYIGDALYVCTSIGPVDGGKQQKYSARKINNTEVCQWFNSKGAVKEIKGAGKMSTHEYTNYLVEVEGLILWETNEAILFDDGEVKIWLPKAFIQGARDLQPSDDPVSIDIPQCLAMEKGLI